jgi:hypothetical protein
VCNVQRLVLNSNRRVGEIKLEEVVDRSIVRKVGISCGVNSKLTAPR